MRKLSLVILLVALAAFAFGKTYVVGTSADFPPFEYVENGEFKGFDMDLIRAIADEMGFNIKIVDMSFDSLIAALVSGNLDIVIAGMTITAEREAVVDFSKPYWTADQSIIVKEDSDYTVTVLFGKHDIGVQTGTTGDLWVEENLVKTKILTGKFKRYDTFVLALTDLINGNVDAIVLDSPVAERFAETRPVKIVGIIVTGEEYGIAVREGNKELLNLINEGIQRLKENGKLGEIVEKYFK
ncbi:MULTISPECIES: basic amino acid ABC transporter substrate-binding protein [Kosmotoga]|jgi:polar amino acid transport system substrate-binding protein|uniref:Extracellular solute-binding protein family 3 n=1 Tax=Kosmotoga olearia (strain ATCC BAA-1733 / DSM 21960 / TBF 19.5.1) TaxID=521045 RepID=C5CIB5_KOSOT|nr:MULTISPECIES: basic amino acid ABC transporter substrate-binding protein [Kosmotoga]ACR78849.1 extracellular solute-binding protein family 3 [Kosmotoga olearia TBF 19.5.1]MDI3524376.1 polar amino acid transport system substrate-binding protein [Kosmotoga sp.]MDK2954377.1 polar amino acid transport system substrate-binding protein [Kosmotoga sp.]OAA25035.1 ABC transporter substrate-binding protein [Kosmotoga sp. DU53]